MRGVDKPALLAAALAGAAGCLDPEGWCDRFGLECEVPPERPTVVDEDGDVWEAAWDCDDQDPLVHPGATEVCDGIDNDCDGEVDEDFEFFEAAPDADADGWGDAEAVELVCELPDGWVEVRRYLDCDDAHPGVNPGAEDDSCDGIDQDCDGWNCSVEDIDDAAFRWSGGGGAFAESLAWGRPAAGGEAWVASGAETGLAVAPLATLLAGDASAADAPVRIDFTDACGEGSVAVALGDVDGDGYDDLLAAHANCGERGVLARFAGPLSGVLTLGEADAALEGDWGDALAVLLVSDELDADGDGEPDLFLGAPGAWSDDGAVFAYPRGDWATAEPEVFTRSGADRLGAAVVDAGDLDGDGVPELVVGQPKYSVGRGAVFVLSLPAEVGGVFDDAEPSWVGRATSERLGVAIAPLGDVDGDGLPDLALAAPWNGGQVYIATAADRAVASAGDIERRVESPPEADGFGKELAAVGDVDGDGFEDLAVRVAELSGGSGLGHGVVALVFGPWEGVVEDGGAFVLLGAEGGASLGETLLGVEADGEARALLVGDPAAEEPLAWVLPPSDLSPP